MKNIVFSQEIQAVCPAFRCVAIDAAVVNTVYSQELWDEIHRVGEQFRATETIDTIKERASIAATRHIYRLCGKDPSRYRPSGEALARRILQGKELYQIDTLVDLINLASLRYGYSISGLDGDRIAGDTLTLGIGKAGEPYEGIGRGPLNIEGIPVYRDVEGGIATPTSDNERTKMTLSTTHLIALVNAYDGDLTNATECARYIQQLIRDCAQSDGGELKQY